MAFSISLGDHFRDIRVTQFVALLLSDHKIPFFLFPYEFNDVLSAQTSIIPLCPLLSVSLDIVSLDNRLDSPTIMQLFSYTVVAIRISILLPPVFQNSNWHPLPNLSQVFWHRLVSDEFHELGERTKILEVLRKYKASYYWGMTGTPKTKTAQDIVDMAKWVDAALRHMSIVSVMVS